MLKKLLIISALLSTLPVVAALARNAAPAAEKCDPYMTAQGGFGYLVENGDKAGVWWAEGIYKVMKDTPLPVRKAKGGVTLSSARNEYESFIVVVKPWQDLKEVKVSVDGLPEGMEVSVRKVEYVNVFYPTDSYTFKGDWPDPLPRYSEPEDIRRGDNCPFWITVKTPKGQKTGKYTGSVRLSSADGWKVEIPVSLKVRNFTLPDTPTVHSGFGFGIGMTAQYENLKTQEQTELVFDKYMQAFKDYKIAPYNPFQFTPVMETLSGVKWGGGLFSSEKRHGGKYSFMVTDKSYSDDPSGSPTREFIAVEGGKTYKVVFHATTGEDMNSTLAVDFYDRDHNLIPLRGKYFHFKGTPQWKEYSTAVEAPAAAAYLKLRIFGAFHTTGQEFMGVTWYDDISITDIDGGANLLPEGDFETDLDEIGISLDFSDYAKTAEKWFGEGGFNGYSLSLKGLGTGTYFSRQEGVIAGFPQGSPEYDKLMEQYLRQMQEGLSELNLLDKAYVYWFDEPERPDYPFIHDTHVLIKKYAPGIRTFLTEHMPDEDLDITDVTDISCTIWHKVDHAKVARINSQAGKEVWTYLCTGPKSPWITEFIDHDAIDMRLWLWASYMYNLKGILVWQTNYWNSSEASPKGYLQDPWTDATCFTSGYDRKLSSDNWGNGDGRFFYPNNRHPNEDKTTVYLDGPVPSVRLETMRDGIEDYEYLYLLEQKIRGKSGAKVRKARELLTLPKEMYQDDTHFSKDPQNLLKRREQIADLIENL